MRFQDLFKLIGVTIVVIGIALRLRTTLVVVVIALRAYDMVVPRVIVVAADQDLLRQTK